MLFSTSLISRYRRSNSVQIDWTVSVGNMLTVVILGFGAITAFFRVQGDIRVIVQELESLDKHQVALESSINQMTQIMSQVAVQSNRIDHLEEDLRELKHGEGFVLPMLRGGPK